MLGGERVSEDLALLLEQLFGEHRPDQFAGKRSDLLPVTATAQAPRPWRRVVAVLVAGSAAASRDETDPASHGAGPHQFHRFP